MAENSPLIWLILQVRNSGRALAVGSHLITVVSAKWLAPEGPLPRRLCQLYIWPLGVPWLFSSTWLLTFQDLCGMGFSWHDGLGVVGLPLWWLDIVQAPQGRSCKSSSDFPQYHFCLTLLSSESLRRTQMQGRVGDTSVGGVAEKLTRPNPQPGLIESILLYLTGHTGNGGRRVSVADRLLKASPGLSCPSQQ